jgi:hypothetical protein
MGPTYCFAAWTDSGFFLGCSHEHETIVGADSCIPCAGGYVVAVENGVMRSLTEEEEAEFQRVDYAPRTGKPPLDAIRVAQEQYRNEHIRYAVMVRIKVGNRYKWATWMTYGTYGEAAANARPDPRIVAFGSPQWVEHKQHSEPIVTNEDHKEFKPSTCAAHTPTRREGETFIEFVVRLLDGYGLNQYAELVSDWKA